MLRQDKHLWLAGFSFIVLLILSIVFFKERIIFIDAAYQAFFLIQEEGFNIQNNRFAEAIPQILPLVAIKFGCPLKCILILFSMSYVLWHFLFFLLSAYVLKDKQMAIGGSLFSVLMVSQTFYWVPSELPMGISFSFFAWAMIRSDQNSEGRRWRYLGYTLLAFSLVFFHPTLLFVVFFSVIFFVLDKKTDAKKWESILLLFIIILILKMVLFEASDYDKNAMGKLNNLKTLFPHYFNIVSNKGFLKNCLTDYYWLIAFLIGIMLFYSKSKEFKKMAFVLCSFIGYLFLINACFL